MIYGLIPDRSLLITEFLDAGRLQFFEASVADVSGWAALEAAHGKGFTHMISGAAITPTRADEEAGAANIMAVNLNGCLHALEFARRCVTLRRFVFISSDAVYEYPGLVCATSNLLMINQSSSDMHLHIRKRTLQTTGLFLIYCLWLQVRPLLAGETPPETMGLCLLQGIYIHAVQTNFTWCIECCFWVHCVHKCVFTGVGTASRNTPVRMRWRAGLSCMTWSESAAIAICRCL